MSSLAIALILVDTAIMAAILFFLLRSGAMSRGSAASRAAGTEELLQRLRKGAEDAERLCALLKKKLKAVEELDAGIRKKQIRLENVINSLEDALAELRDRPPVRPAGREDYREALIMLRAGERPEEVAKRLGLYKGEIELLAALSNLDSR
ncbi:MAG TPA: DUF2802 domain-containing protein [Deltaproteobacteria bacterium]|nr:DUF2802 domain-containing protein [Deltaproteobacteria bacterium]